jgi:sugar phosphate isomerase/epimerase
MPNRRRFLQLSIAAAAGGLAAKKLVAAERPGRRPFGVQLYSVRDQAAHDLASVLESIRKIGYTEVETYWDIYGHPAAELRRMMTDHGLTVPSGHFNYDGLESKIDYAKTLGMQFMICPILPESMWFALDDYKRAADKFNVCGEKIRQAGMQFGFHNHNYEFRRFGDTTGFETIMTRCDPKLVCIEMDCYWIAQAGENTLQMFQKYGDRIKLLHLKDRKSGFPTTQVKDAAAEHFTEIGAGTIHWEEILAAAEKNDVQHYFVERDSGDLPVLESLRISFQNLQKMS